MKIDTSQKDVEIIGDIKEFKTSIDPKNLEFITTLLSSNLYSNPEQSFIREIVSNAWDSHVEAGNTDVPVIVKFSKNNCKWGITIRDYGVGLSPERFSEIYCNIGSSTKRESNEFTGGFGIGRYSAIACSNSVYLISYYKGTAYFYIMIKSGNSITTNLIRESSTNEKDGLEVTIKGIEDINPYINALQYIIFFPNIYIDGVATENNSIKIKHFKNFSAATTTKRIPHKLLLGNVLYPINTSYLSKEASSFISRIYYTGIVVKFNIGEINITPNRENVIYTSDTIKVIEDRVLAAKEELNNLIKNIISKDYDDIIEYSNIMSKIIKYNPIENSINTNGWCYEVDIEELNEIPITYKGLDLSKDIRYLYSILSMDLPNYKGTIYDGSIYKKRLPYRAKASAVIKSPNTIILNSGVRFTADVLGYIRSKYSNNSIISNIEEDAFINWIKQNEVSYITSPDNKDFILKEVYKSFKNRAIRLDTDTNPEFLKYKEELIKSKKGNKTPKIIKDVILYLYNHHGYYREKKTFKDINKAIEFIKDIHRGVILINIDNEELFYDIAKIKGYVCISARKDIIEEIKKMELNCIVDPTWLIKKDPLLSIAKTLFDNPIEISRDIIRKIGMTLDTEIQSEFLRIYSIMDKIRGTYTYKTLIKNDNIPYDSYTENLYNKLKTYISSYVFAENIAKEINCYDTDIISAIILKCKLYRISADAYKRIKNNKVIQILCKS